MIESGAVSFADRYPSGRLVQIHGFAPSKRTTAAGQRADLILVVEDGRIVERGRHQELLQREGRYHQLYTIQARI